MAYKIEQIKSPNYQAGRSSAIKYIVIHWWDNPAKKPSITGVINHFKNPAVEVSAHYVVSGDRVVQMVQEKDTAWHAIQANPYTIGIEVDPNTPGNTYQTLGRLVREIRQRHGNLPLKKHSDFNSTACPGTIDLARIDREAKATKPSAPAQGGDMADANDVKAIYQYGPLGRTADPGGLKNYTGKKTDLILKEHAGSAEAKAKAAQLAKYKADAALVPGLKAEVAKLKASQGTGSNADISHIRAKVDEILAFLKRIFK